jgi:putative tricarboxylic transport membrane protein
LAPLVLVVLAAAALVAAVRMGLGSPSNPGPGAWPLVTAGALLVSSAWLLLTGLEAPEATATHDLLRVLAAVIALAVFVATLPVLGMPVPAFLVLVTWMRVFDQSWRASLVTALVAVVTLQTLFVYLLAVPLPVGPLAPGR